VQILDPFRRLNDKIWLHGIKRYHGRIGHRAGRRHDRYWQHARHTMPQSAPDEGAMYERAKAFRQQGFVSWSSKSQEESAKSVYAEIAERSQAGEAVWQPDSWAYQGGNAYLDFVGIQELLKGPVSRFLMENFECPFKFVRMVLYRSVRETEADGSKLWHADGGAGTCVNFLIYITPGTKQNGAMEILPWRETVEITAVERHEMRKRLRSAPRRLIENRLELRRLKTKFYDEYIDQNYRNKVEQPTGPAGMILSFRNNCLHKGGYPDPGEERIVLAFSAYPSHRPVPWERYDREGIATAIADPNNPAKTMSILRDPDMDV
jgi:hypothetical protein